MPIMVQISELRHTSAEGKPVFRDLNFRLHRGEWACIFGKPAEAKALLLPLVCGELRPDHGQILVDDRNVSRLSPEKRRQLRRRIGIVPHDLEPLRRRTLLGGLTFQLRALGATKEEAGRRAHEVLELVGLSESAERPVRELGELERRLFRLALALDHDPVLLLLEDPLAGLSKADRARYLRVLSDLYLRKRLSILMTVEEPRDVQEVPCALYRLEGGRLHSLQPAAPAARPSEGTPHE
jgi:ABC-type ATPase involved in cell division